ncbi:predicted protein [Aspergillus terreus NIH2624]|uniref:Zn(2)-C6 fungal-type domain-containing protein n=1 Tax=Aspergillus terreus (strain NIH 2624 / FGSC A1156) TaxID=341663 RepID=Q0CPY8_ASPTN|nr:uncharacterized protein ATEG_04246 [Aspergillus terreus NIH2624]EAU36048.1 predicted protein [Aspergillus terreus NIH2624]
MNSTVSGHRPIWQETEAGPPGKPTKACAPCRVRKVKCDATVKGLPCNGCEVRHLEKLYFLALTSLRTERTLPPRKGARANTRDRENNGSLPPDYSTDSRQSSVEAHDESARAESYSHCQPTPDSLDCQGFRQAQTELHYLNILKDAVDDTASNRPDVDLSVASTSPVQEETLASQIRLLHRPPQLDDVHREFLAKKGVFDLPPQPCLDSLLKTYFDYIYPYGPVIDPVEFLRTYQSGHYSLFLLYSMLAPATLYAPVDILYGCGFSDRSSAQASFVAKATLLHDFQVETNLLPLLQGSIILGMVVLDYPTDKDFYYWFYNSTRLAAKLDIHKASAREDRAGRCSKLYRRIWWVLYCRDIFLHMYSGTRSLRIIGNDPGLKPITKHDWREPGEVPREFQSMLLPISSRQKSYFMAVCELAQIVGRLVSAVADDQGMDPQQVIRPLATWRMTLADKMQMQDPSTEGDIYYADLLGSSYRFESTICRSIRHAWQSRDTDRYEWAKARLRAAILELDAIARRISINGTIQKFPVSFMTAIPTLLALHIESALDTSETDLIRSMSRISIGQTMLVLNELREIPVIKRAMPIFEVVLAKKNLYPTSFGPADSVPQIDDRQNEPDLPRPQMGAFVPQDVQGDCTFYLGDFIDFDVLDRWEVGQLDSPAIF